MERLENFKVQVGLLIVAEIVAIIMLGLSGIPVSVGVLAIFLV